MTRLFFLVFCIILTSCFGNSARFTEVGMCVKEVNTRYVASTSKAKQYYKVEDVTSNLYRLSSYANSGWHYLGHRDFAYLDDKENFKYEETDCPGENTMTRKLSDRLNMQFGKKTL